MPDLGVCRPPMLCHRSRECPDICTPPARPYATLVARGPAVEVLPVAPSCGHRVVPQEGATPKMGRSARR
eukprot:9482939-Pyramimonas_sp.AAC.1